MSLPECWTPPIYVLVDFLPPSPTRPKIWYSSRSVIQCPCAQLSVLVIKFVSYLHFEQFSGNVCEQGGARRGAAVYQVSGTQFYAGILHLLHQRRKRHPQKKVDSILSVPLHCCVEVLSPLEARGTWLSQLGQIQSVHSIMNTTHRRRSIIVQQLNLEFGKGGQH